MRLHPERYIVVTALPTGAELIVRPIRPDDEGMMVRFHENLSDQSVYQRYFHMMTLAHRTAHERLARVCGVDHDREVVLVAVAPGDARTEPAILGVARLERGGDTRVGEFAVVVADGHQRSGVGTALMRQLVNVARLEGCVRLRADVLADNGPMRRLCLRLGLSVHPTTDPRVVEAVLEF